MAKVSKRAKIAVLITAAVLVVVVPLTIFFTTIGVYEGQFGKRFTTGVHNKTAFALSDFPGLTRTDSDFSSDKGQRLKGYVYRREGDCKGLIVLAHGYGGGGHNSYLPDIDSFTSRGYTVFAYDGTGTDESEGKSVRGLPQGVIDLHHALLHVESDETLSALPLLLYGHSWGGYAVSAVNLFPGHEVKAIVERSGFIRSADVMEALARPYLGGVIGLVMPFIKLYESMKFGRVSSYTGIDGLKATRAKVLVAHSADDPVVGFANYERYWREFSGDSRFTFLRWEDRGHGVIYRPETSEAIADAMREYDEAVPVSSGGAEAALAKAKALQLQVDTEVFDTFASFFDDAVTS